MQKKTGIEKAVGMYGDSPAKLAAAIGDGVLRQHVEHWLKAKRVSAEKCPQVSVLTGIPCEELNDKVSWSLVREVKA